jgi:hypothetical protein
MKDEGGRMKIKESKNFKQNYFYNKKIAFGFIHPSSFILHPSQKRRQKLLP